MGKAKKRDALVEEMARLRRPIRQQVQNTLEHECRQRRATGELPYAGVWVPRDLLDVFARKLGWRRWLSSFEVLFGLLLLLAVEYGVFRLFRWLIYPS
jgi:hypothetical protein